MLKVFLLGHTYAHSGQRPVHLSTKAVALITYLALEGRVHHRDHMAALLWNHGDARQNLRVELARIRSAGISGFPLGERLLTVHHSSTDLDAWESGLQDCGAYSDEQVQGWLSIIRGLPLSGLDDLGGSEFRTWVDHQRHLIINRLAEGLEQAYKAYARQRRSVAAQMVNARLQLLGCPTLPPLSEHVDEVQFEREESAQLREIMRRVTQHPQVLLLRGEIGSGKSYEVRRLVQESQALGIYCDSHSLHLTLAIIAQRIRPHLPPELAQELGLTLSQAPSQGQVVAVASALTQLSVPAVLYFDQAERASAELAGLIQLLVNSDTRVLCVLSTRQTEAGAPGPGGALVQQLRRVLPEERSHVVRLQPLPLSSVTDVLRQLEPLQQEETTELQALKLLQTTGGNPLLLREALQDRTGEHLTYATMAERLDSEIDSWPAPLRQGLEALSLLLTPLNEALVAELEVTAPGEATRFLSDAHACGALCEHRRLQGARLSAGRIQTLGTRTALDSLFRDEHLRVRLASRLAPPRRLEMNRRLARLFAQRDPGLSRFYAARAGLEARDLGAPLSAADRTLTPVPRLSGAVPPLVEPPPTTPVSQAPLSVDGYRLMLDHGWLRVLRRGRYGPAQTLTVQIPVGPEDSAPRSVTLIWRLDDFSGAFQFDPREVPFPLGVWTARGGAVLTPYDQPDFEEQGQPVTALSTVTLGQWMRHTLPLPARDTGPWIELRCRSLDLNLTIAALQIGSAQRLPVRASGALIPSVA